MNREQRSSGLWNAGSPGAARPCPFAAPPLSDSPSSGAVAITTGQEKGALSLRVMHRERGWAPKLVSGQIHKTDRERARARE